MHFIQLGHRTLDKMERSSVNVDQHSHESLSKAQVHSLHHALRERLPAGATGMDVAREVDEIRQARELLGMDVKGIHFMPARVDATNIHAPGLFNRPMEPGVVEFDLSELMKHREGMPPPNMHLKMPIQVDMLNPREYAIEWYGMQGSHMPPGTPANVQRWYNGYAPQLGLALMAKALKHAGAERVLIPGEGFATARKGYKKPGFLNWMRRQRALRKTTIDPEIASLLANRFHTLTNEQIYYLIEGDPILTKFGFPPKLIRHYYRDIPSTFRTRTAKVNYPFYPAGQHDFYDLDLKQLEPMKLFFRREEDHNLTKEDRDSYYEP